MQEFQWKQVDSDRAVYRYQSRISPQPVDPAAMPVLLVMPLPPETAISLARMFQADGFSAIYACTVTGSVEQDARELDTLVEELFSAHHPQHRRLVIVGCASGGLVARQYVMTGGYRRVAFLFMLGSAHRYTHLAYLDETILERLGNEVTRPEVGITSLGNAVLVNIFSELISSPRYVHLPDAINLALPLEEESLCRDPMTYQAMQQCLMGSVWLVTVRLHSLVMRNGNNGSSEARTGPFCFEVNGWRSPFDGVFRVPVETLYAFDPEMALLGTVPYPLTNAGRAVDLSFRLKDLSPPSGERRKLSASLHTPLRDGLIAEHVLMDSFGSEVGIQVRCNRPYPVLKQYDE